MNILGILANKLVMERSNLLKNSHPKRMHNEFGITTVFFTEKIAFVLRHGNKPRHYVLPHAINHRANLKALYDVGVEEIIGIHSTGSLKKVLHPGTIVIPDDFLTLTATPTIFNKRAVHITPALSEKIRKK